MRIERLQLDGFGRFDGTVQWTFGPGLNVILGPNESGKSTMQESILAILFGFEDKATEERFRPRAGRQFKGQVELVRGDEHWKFSRDFDDHLVTVTRRRGKDNHVLYQGDANPRGRTDDLVAYLDVLSDCLAVTDRGLFQRTLVIRQGEMSTSIDETIRQLLSGSRQGDYDTVLTRLEDRFFGLTRENPWSNRKKNRPREIEELEERIGTLTTRLERARASLRQGGTLLSELESAGQALTRLKGEREQKDLLFDSFREFFELNRERSELEKRLSILRDEKEKVKGFDAECRRAQGDIDARLGHFRGVGPEFGDHLRQLSTLERDVAALTDEHRRREAELAANPWPSQTKRSFVIGGAMAIVTALAMWGAGVGWPSIAIGLVVGVLTIVGLYFLGKGRERERIQLETSSLEMESRVESMRGEMSRLDGDIRQRVGNRRLSEVMEEWRQYGELADLVSRHEQIRDSHRPLAAVEADYDAVFQKLKLADARARDLIARSPYLANADQNMEDVSMQVERLRKERELLLAEERRESGNLEALRLRRARQEGGQVDDAECLEDELAECRERLTSLRFRRDAFRMAVDVLRQSVAEFQEGHLDRLAGKAAEPMSRITGGRWRQIVLDADFVPHVVDSGGQSFDSESLSQGTRDQLHLSLRLALVDSLFGDAGPPLLVDDVLVNCDAERLGLIRAALAGEVERGRQILLFSHEPAYASWGGTTIRLSAAAKALVG